MSQDGVTVLEEPKTRSRTAKKAAAATPPPIEGMKPAPESADVELFSLEQLRRLESLKAAKELLGRDLTAGELIALATYIEGNTALDQDDTDVVLTFTGAPTMEGTNQ